MTADHETTFIDHTNLSNPESRRLSSNSVVIETNNKKKFDVLFVTNELLRLEVVEILLHYFTLPEYTSKIKAGEKATQNKIVDTFLSYLKLHLKEKVEKSPTQIIREYIKYLYKKNPNLTSWINLNRLQKIILSSASTKYGKISSWPKNIKAYFIALKNHTPPKPQHKKTPPISIHLGIPKSEFSDSELLMGLRYGSIWVLQKLHELKESIKEDNTVSSYLNQHYHTNISDFNKKTRWIATIRHPRSYTKEEKEKRQFARAILDSYIRSPLLSEWQCYTFPSLHYALFNHRNSLLSTEDQKEILSLYKCEKIFITKTAKNSCYESTTSLWEPLKQLLDTSDFKNYIPKFHLWGSRLISHTNLEKFLMTWLLATERAQKSGINNLTLDDVHFSMASNGKPKSLQISTLKLRRHRSTNPNNIHVKTQIYNKKSPLFEVYRRWHPVVVKESVASEVIQAARFSGSTTVTCSSRSGLSDTVPMGAQLRVLPLQRAGLAARAA